VGGVGEVLRHGENGWLIKSGDPEAIRQRVVSLLNDQVQLKRMGRAGQASIEEHFGFKRRTRDVERLYEGLHVTPASFARPHGAE
jgi:glycosyltransferase involved in cell wall biosynthesis